MVELSVGWKAKKMVVQREIVKVLLLVEWKENKSVSATVARLVAKLGLWKVLAMGEMSVDWMVVPWDVSKGTVTVVSLADMTGV